MSNNGSAKDSGSSGSSPNQALMWRDNSAELSDLTLFGSSINVLSRTGTVRRASAPTRREKETSIEEPSGNSDKVCSVPQTSTKLSPKSSPDLHPPTSDPTRYRRSLDSTYRLSLESISEYKAKSSFSATSLFTSRDGSSMESSSSDHTDFAMRSSTDPNRIDEKTLISPGSSYLSWIESVNSEYFGSTATIPDCSEADSKVGEWNNFWLNYNSARSRYMSSPYLSVSNDATDDFSDARSTGSTHKELTEKNSSMELINLSIDEINEAIKCSQRVTEILQNALKRSDHEFDESKNDSCYSQALSQQNSVKEETVVQRERSFSYVVDAQELQKQKQLLKPTAQSSSSSCINALLNTGVADILKRVITKRRDVFAPDNDSQSITRSSFSDWSSAK